MTLLLAVVATRAWAVPAAFNAAVSVASAIVVCGMLVVIVLLGLIARSRHRIREGHRDR